MKEEKRHSLLDNILLVDNVSEALTECIGEGYIDYSMLICEGLDKEGGKFQVHIKVTYDSSEFISNDEEMPTFRTDEENRLSHEITYSKDF